MQGLRHPPSRYTFVVVSVKVWSEYVPPRPFCFNALATYLKCFSGLEEGAENWWVSSLQSLNFSFLQVCCLCLRFQPIGR